jgi:hypothetical protein
MPVGAAELLALQADAPVDPELPPMPVHFGRAPLAPVAEISRGDEFDYFTFDQVQPRPLGNAAKTTTAYEATGDLAPEVDSFDFSASGAHISVSPSGADDGRGSAGPGLLPEFAVGDLRIDLAAPALETGSEIMLDWRPELADQMGWNGDGTLGPDAFRIA